MHVIIFYHSVQANIDQNIFQLLIAAIQSSFMKVPYVHNQILSRYQQVLPYSVNVNVASTQNTFLLKKGDRLLQIIEGNRLQIYVPSVRMMCGGIGEFDQAQVLIIAVCSYIVKKMLSHKCSCSFHQTFKVDVAS